jgi:hypothetical protein
VWVAGLLANAQRRACLSFLFRSLRGAVGDSSSETPEIRGNICFSIDQTTITQGLLGNRAAYGSKLVAGLYKETGKLAVESSSA